MKLTKAEAELLLPIGVTEFAGTDEELRREVTGAYWVIDDAPYPYWEREKLMKVLERLAGKMGFEISAAF